jgi:hypothetical protein
MLPKLARIATAYAQRTGRVRDLRRAWFLRELASWLRGGGWTAFPLDTAHRQTAAFAASRSPDGAGGTQSALGPRTDRDPPATHPTQSRQYLPAGLRIAGSATAPLLPWPSPAGLSPSTEAAMNARILALALLGIMLAGLVLIFGRPA